MYCQVCDMKKEAKEAKFPHLQYIYLIRCFGVKYRRICLRASKASQNTVQHNLKEK